MNSKHISIILLLKKHILTFIFCIFPICLLLFSKSNLIAARNGLLLWANSIVPSLLPFFVATELLSYTNVINNLVQKSYVIFLIKVYVQKKKQNEC